VRDWSRRRGLIGAIPERATPNPLTVLVVDQDGDAWSPVADILRVAGFMVIQAGAGRDTLRIVHHMRFDAIVLDVSVPDLDLLSLLTMLPEPPPVVLLSSFRSEKELRTRLARRAAAHLQKPVEPEVLVGAVARAAARDRP
jgi:DNA-binding response OmpR family regulator